jgi:ABC-2 type transport system ATP-binding protein
VILSTHILPEVEMVCDHVQIIDKGKLVFNGSIDVLKQQRHGNKLLVGLNTPPAQADLLKIVGVEAVELLNNGLLRVSYKPGQAPTEAIVQAAVKKGWGLHQINPDQTSLEDVFVQLTYQDAAA